MSNTVRVFVRARAPFAAWRPFTAGTYRPTYPVPPPSATYSLALAVLGIEVRDVELDRLPRLRVACGQLRVPSISAVLRQAHHKPVGAADKEARAMAKGTKHLIAPVRYEVACGIDLVLGLEGRADELGRLTAMLLCREGAQGLLYAGDSGMLWSDLAALPDEAAACGLAPRWWSRRPTDADFASESLDLPVCIHREDASWTEVVCLGPTPPDPTRAHVPDDVWVDASPFA